MNCREHRYTDCTICMALAPDCVYYLQPLHFELTSRACVHAVLHVCTYIHACMCVCVHVYVRMYMYMHLSMYTMCPCMHSWVCVCVAYMYVNVYLLLCSYFWVCMCHDACSLCSSCVSSVCFSHGQEMGEEWLHVDFISSQLLVSVRLC